MVLIWAFIFRNPDIKSGTKDAAHCLQKAVDWQVLPPEPIGGDILMESPLKYVKNRLKAIRFSKRLQEINKKKKA